jgi:hypothetical protein
MHVAAKEIWVCILLLMYDICDFIMLNLNISNKNTCHIILPKN